MQTRVKAVTSLLGEARRDSRFAQESRALNRTKSDAGMFKLLKLDGAEQTVDAIEIQVLNSTELLVSERSLSNSNSCYTLNKTRFLFELLELTIVSSTAAAHIVVVAVD